MKINVRCFSICPSVVEVHWDGGGHAHQKWDGSRKSETMEQFISQMGTSGEHIIHVQCHDGRDILRIHKDVYIVLLIIY